MNAFNRLFAIILALVLIAAGAFTVVVIVDAQTLDQIGADRFASRLVELVESGGGDVAENAGVAAALILVGAFLLILESRAVMARPRMVLVSGGQEGSVRIALDSIRELAEKTASANRSVRSLKCRVRVTSAGLRILCQARLNLGSDVPTVSSELQRTINDALERLTGLNVVDVSVRASYGGDGELSLVAR